MKYFSWELAPSWLVPCCWGVQPTWANTRQAGPAALFRSGNEELLLLGALPELLQTLLLDSGFDIREPQGEGWTLPQPGSAQLHHQQLSPQDALPVPLWARNAGIGMMHSVLRVDQTVLGSNPGAFATEQ